MNKEYDDLESKAQNIVQYLGGTQRHSLPRPFFIEFAGPASSGKSSIIEDLDGDLRKLGFRVKTPQEGAKAIRHIDRTTPLYNLRTALHALTDLIDEGAGNKHDIVIFERCTFDAYCWMMYWENKGKLSAEDRALIQSFYMLDYWRNTIDLTYLVVCDPEVAVQRQVANTASGKEGKTTNPKTIRSLTENYHKAFSEVSKILPNMHVIDTTHQSPQEINAWTIQNTIQTMEQSIKK